MLLEERRGHGISETTKRRILRKDGLETNLLGEGGGSSDEVTVKNHSSGIYRITRTLDDGEVGTRGLG